MDKYELTDEEVDEMIDAQMAGDDGDGHSKYWRMWPLGSIAILRRRTRLGAEHLMRKLKGRGGSA